MDTVGWACAAKGTIARYPSYGMLMLTYLIIDRLDQPSFLLVACLLLGLYHRGGGVQPRELELLSGCKLVDLRGVVELLHAEHGQATVMMSTVRRKYRAPNLGGVANILGVDPAKIGWR